MEARWRQVGGLGTMQGLMAVGWHEAYVDTTIDKVAQDTAWGRRGCTLVVNRGVWRDAPSGRTQHGTLTTRIAAPDYAARRLRIGIAANPHALADHRTDKHSYRDVYACTSAYPDSRQHPNIHAEPNS